MNSELFIVCESHDPTLRSEAVARLGSLDAVREWIAHRNLIANCQAAGLGAPVRVDRVAGAFLGQHPRCRLALIDDRGTRHPVTEGGRRAGAARARRGWDSNP